MSDSTFEKKGLTKKSENISEWYHDVVLRAGLADYSDVKGCMIIKPHGYALWERTQETLDSWFKADGVQNVYFPVFIPLSLLEKEKEHVAGFSPELAVVTHAGGEELAEPLAVRPTSETIMYTTFADWIQSYRELPLKINQWCNVVRWEKRTYPFLRTSEFLWQEGHTAHVDHDSAEAMTLKALEWYRKFYEEYYSISAYIGMKSEGEKFAGAKTTYGVEIVIPDGKALQSATSHNLSDNFAKPFDVQYLDAQGMKQYVHQTSWGLSTRAIGALVLSHGDDSGLVLPPAIAPQQVVILAIGAKEETQQTQAIRHATGIAEQLKNAGIRVVVDADFNHSLGFRINEWELKGVPLRLEIGMRDIEEGTVLSVRRDTFAKKPLPQNDIVSRVQSELDDIQKELLERSMKMKKELTVDVDDYATFRDIMSTSKRFIRTLWCESRECETNIKRETTATPRVLELERIQEHTDGVCIACGEKAHRHWLFAQSY